MSVCTSAWGWSCPSTGSPRLEQCTACSNSSSPRITNLHQPGNIQEACSTGCCPARATTQLPSHRTPTPCSRIVYKKQGTLKVRKSIPADFHLFLTRNAWLPSKGSIKLGSKIFLKSSSCLQDVHFQRTKIKILTHKNAVHSPDV